MAASALFLAISKLAPPVIELVTEIVKAIQGSTTKRDAARKLAVVAARRIVLG